jgi:hypothetical protein
VLTAEYAFLRPDLATEPIGTVVPEGVRPSEPSQRSRDLRTGAHADESRFHRQPLGLVVRRRSAGNARQVPRRQAGLDGKFRLRDIANYGAPALTFAALYVYLHQEPLGLGLVAFNDAQVNEPGHIGVFQTKLELPTANNAIRIPLSFTYSNRTELIRETDVRGQIGISFNLDALFVEKK